MACAAYAPLFMQSSKRLLTALRASHQSCLCCVYGQSNYISTSHFVVKGAMLTYGCMLLLPSAVSGGLQSWWL